MKKIKTASVIVLSSVILLASMGTAFATVDTDKLNVNSLDEITVLMTGEKVITDQSGWIAEIPSKDDDIMLIASDDYDAMLDVDILIYYADGVKDNLIEVDGEIIDLEGAKIYGENGKLMIPLRVVSEALGYKITWNKERLSVDLIKGDNFTSISIGKDNYFYGKTAPIELGIAPELKDGKTYVPLQFVKQILRTQATVNGSESIQIVTKK
jgi:hypothetical protein